MKVPVLSSLILFHARQAGGGYHSLLPSGGGPRTHTGVIRWGGGGGGGFVFHHFYAVTVHHSARHEKQEHPNAFRLNKTLSETQLPGGTEQEIFFAYHFHYPEPILNSCFNQLELEDIEMRSVHLYYKWRLDCG